MRRSITVLATALMPCAAPVFALEYREDFDGAGKPEAPPGLEWSYRAELCPVKTWRNIVPGDGYSYLSVRRDWLERRRASTTAWPFQTLTVGPVTPEHRFSMRARSAAITGVASMIFTHRESGRIDEIDIEIAADDNYSPKTGHPIGPEGGWTDVRFNTYAGADPEKFAPSRRLHRPIVDAQGNRVTHHDGQFHTYAFEWRKDSVRFFIDGVEQSVIDDCVPQGPANLIFGLRQMPWAGEPQWDGYRTMLVDWISIEPLDGK